MRSYKLLFAFLLMLLTVIGFSQEKDWKFSVAYYPHMSFPMEKGIEYEGRLLTEYETKYSNTIGIRVSKKVGEKWIANVGLNYSNIGHKENWDSLYFNLDIDPNTGEINGTIIDAVAIRNLNFIEIPLGVSRILKQNEKSNLYVNLGLSSKYYLFGRTILKYEENGREKVDRSDSYQDEYQSKINFGIQSSIGYSHKLIKGIDYYIEPQIQFDLIGNNPPAKSKLIDYISVGLVLGVTI